MWPWFATAVPNGTAAPICAVNVIVTDPPAGMVPFHVTMLPQQSDAVPLVADAPIGVSPEGSWVTNSLLGPESSIA